MNEKIISLVTTGATFICSCIWLFKTKGERYEPFIFIITTGVALGAQIWGLFKNSSKFILEAPAYSAARTVNRLFDFGNDKGEITIKPFQMPYDYWRIGFKMSELRNVSAHGHLEHGTALFTVEQTQSDLTCSYHVNSARIGNAYSLSRNYLGEKISISYREIGISIEFDVKINGKSLYIFPVPASYRYGRLMSFADDHDYKLKVKILDRT